MGDGRREGNQKKLNNHNCISAEYISVKILWFNGNQEFFSVFPSSRSLQSFYRVKEEEKKVVSDEEEEEEKDK